MLSNVSDITRLAGSSSDALMGSPGSGADATDSGATVSGFQGKLDNAMGQAPGTTETNAVSTASQSTSEVSTVVEDTGADFSESGNAQTSDASFSTAQAPNLSSGEQTTDVSAMDQARPAVRTAKQKVSDVEDALENGGGTEFLTQLKSLLLSICNGDLDNLSIDEDGLAALGDLLVQAGFDQASVEELISDLTLSLEQGDGLISVSDFMGDLFELPIAEDEDITGAETIMPTSDLPYIKSLLSMMGVDEQEIASIMAEASEGTKGFDFDTFIEQLEQLSDTMGDAGLYQTDLGDDAYITLIEQLDLDSFIEESDGPLTLTTLIDAFTRKLDAMEDLKPGQTEQTLPDAFTATPAEALATESGRQGLLNQLFSGLTIPEDSEDTVEATVTLGANSGAMAKNIEDRFQVRFMDQINREEATTKTGTDGATAANLSSSDIQIKESASDQTVKIADKFSTAAGTTRESASQLAAKAAQADTAALEKAVSGTNSQSTETTSKLAESQTLVLGVERSTTTPDVKIAGTQRTQQAFSTLPDFVTRQVGKSIVRSISTGDDTIRMQLKPPELGKVYMSIDHNGSSMKVSVITEHQSAKDILAANVNEIKTMLSSSGISLESFEVDMSSDFQQSMADARAQDQSAGKQQAKNSAGSDAQEEAAEDLTIQSTVMNHSSSLHFVA